MTVMKYPGSKKSIAHWIIDHFPPDYQNLTYLEPFFGSGCVFFSKENSQIEIINDYDSEIYNLFLQIRDNAEQLAFLIEHTPWSRREYNEAFETSSSPIEKARRFLIRTWFCIGSAYTEKNSMRILVKPATDGRHENFNKKLPFTLIETSKRLKSEAGRYVQIENRDALKVIPQYDRKNVFMYLDPPYVTETRKHKRIYTNEMTDEEHIKLLEMICGLKAFVLISGYDNEIYRRYLSGWNKDTKKSKDMAGNKRIECLWFNYNTHHYDLFSQGVNNAG
jgi:DNA adenine methylase